MYKFYSYSLCLLPSIPSFRLFPCTQRRIFPKISFVACRIFNISTGKPICIFITIICCWLILSQYFSSISNYLVKRICYRLIHMNLHHKKWFSSPVESWYSLVFICPGIFPDPSFYITGVISSHLHIRKQISALFFKHYLYHVIRVWRCRAVWYTGNHASYFVLLIHFMRKSGRCCRGNKLMMHCLQLIF